MRFRVEAGARPVGATGETADVERGIGTTNLRNRRGPEHLGLHAIVLLDDIDGLGTQFRREVDQVFGVDRLARISGGLGREGLRLGSLLAGHVGLGDGLFNDRPDRLAGQTVEHIEERLLGRHGNGLDRLAVDIDVGQQRRRGHVIVPDRVMGDLEVPLQLTGVDVQANDAVAIEIVARTGAAVGVVGRIFDGHINQARFAVHGHGRPGAGVAVEVSRVLFPAFIAGLALLRDVVEDPEHLAGLGIERAGQALGVVLFKRLRAFLEGRTDQDDIVHHGGGGVQADFAGHQVNLLVLAGLADDAVIGADLEVHDALFAEAFDRLAGMGVQFHQAIAGGDIDDAIIALAVGPVGHAAAGQLARRNGGAQAFIHRIDPLQFAGLGIQRNHVAARAGGGIDGAVDFDRGAFELVLGMGAHLVGLELPGHFQLVEVGAVDLVERQITRSGRIREIHGPVALGGGRLAIRRGLCPGRSGHHADQQRHRRRAQQPALQELVTRHAFHP